MVIINDRIRKLMGSPWALIPAGAAILLIPALINGFPFYFFDTAGYHLLGRGVASNVAEILFHAAQGETAAPPQPTTAAAPTASPAAAPAADDGALVANIGTHSPLYGLFVYIGAALGSYWLVAIAQCVLAAWLISACLRALDLASPRAFFITVAALTGFSTLGFFAADLMPDVFTGFAFALVALLFAPADRFSLAERIAFCLLLAASVVAHPTNLPLTITFIALCACAAALARAGWRTIGKQLALPAAAVVMALAFNASYALAVRVALGRAPGGAPYLMARVLADGPGRLYLHDACAPEPRFEICRYADRPLDDVNDFLWNTDSRVGVIMLADAASRERLRAEERAFVVGVLTHYPLQQLQASLGNGLALAFKIQVADDIGFARSSWLRMNMAELDPRDDRAARASLAFRGAYPVAALDFLGCAGVVLAIGFLGWRLSRTDVRASFAAGVLADDYERNIRRVLAGLAVALVIWLVVNAFMCGALSGVFARYQARTIWLAPLLGVLVYLRLGLGAKPASVAR